MWVNAKEAFTQSDENGDVENRIGRELVQLHAVNEKKPTKKFVGGKR